VDLTPIFAGRGEAHLSARAFRDSFPRETAEE
jgi:hypothetical protein